MKSMTLPMFPRRLRLDGLIILCLTSTLVAVKAQTPAVCTGGSGTSITVANFKASETIAYGLPLIKGLVATSASQVTITMGGVTATWPAAGGLYKAFLPLKQGDNHAVISAVDSRNACLDIRYQPNAFTTQIQLAILVPDDLTQGQSLFAAPQGEPSDLASAIKRVRFGFMLHQSILAEAFGIAGKGHLASNVKLDSAGEPEVLLVPTTKTFAELAKDDVMASALAETEGKNREDGRTRYVFFNAHSKGLFNIANGEMAGLDDIHTWPQDLSELLSRFTDTRTFAELNFPAGTKDTNSLSSSLYGSFGFWFRCTGNFVLGSGAVDKEAKDPIGAAYNTLYRLFLVKTRDGVNIAQEDIALSQTSLNNLLANPWVTPAVLPSKPALAQSAIPSGISLGLDYKYYEGAFDKLPDFPTFNPAATGSIPNFSLDARKREDNFALAFSGFIRIPKAGSFLFRLNADDGVKLLIDSQMVAVDDGVHGTGNIARGIALDSGLHRIQLQYFDGAGGKDLLVRWTADGIPLQPIPNGVLFHPASISSIAARVRGSGPMTLRRSGTEAFLNCPSDRFATLSLVSPAGRRLTTIFSGFIPGGSRRFQIPSEHASPGNILVLE